MNKNTRKTMRRTLSVVLSLLIVLSAVSVGFVFPVAAASADKLIARYFSTDYEWYDAVSGSNQLDWQSGSFTSYQADGSHYFNGTAYLKILTQDLFSGVSADTGMAFSYQWKADQTDAHRHIISLGANEYEGSSNANSSFYVSATTSWMSSNKAPFVGYVNSNGDQLIGAYPAGAPDFASGVTYDITVSVSVTNGVVFYINGVKYDAAYQLTTGASNLAAQQANIAEFLNSVSGWNNHYIGASRWADGNIKGYLKDLCIYNAALTDTEVIVDLVDQNAVQTAFNSEDGSSFAAQANTFNAAAYHQGAEAVGAYSNLVYSPIWTTSWSGVGGADQAIAVGRQDLKIAIPRNVVMVYDGTHDVYAPIIMETKCNQSSGDTQKIHYFSNYSSIFTLQSDWVGSSITWDAWVPNAIETDDSFAYYDDNNYNETSQDMRNTGTSRFWYNRVWYTGTGNTTSYYDHESNLSYYGKTSYKERTGDRQYKYGDVTSCTDFYAINYQPIYSQLSNATAVLQELKANEWMYTDESVTNAKATLYLMAQSNPNNYDYGSGVDAQVQACAATIKQAKTMIDAGGLTLVKKTGTATFNYDDGTEYQTVANVTYGDSFTVPDVPAKESDNLYDYIDGRWTPAATPGSAVMSDTYNQTFTATYTQASHAWSLVNDTPGTCSSYGLRSYVCSRCGATSSERMPMNSSNHNYQYNSFVWSEEGGTVTAKARYVCTYNNAHTDDRDASVTSVDYEATYATGAYTVYTATYDGHSEQKTYTIPVDTTNLAADIATYQTLADDAAQYTLASREALQAAIDAAQALVDQYAGTTVTGTDKDDLVTAFEAARDAMGDVELTIQTYNITFEAGENTTLVVKANGEEIASGAAIDYGTVLTIEAAPTEAYSQNTVTVKVNGTDLEGTTYTVTGAVAITTDAIDEANINKYTVTWKNGNETIETDTNVPYGMTPSYDGETPVCPDNNAQYTYTWTGWTPEVVAVDGDATYTATFSSEGTTNTYTVTFVDEDGETVLKAADAYDYGTAIASIAPAATKDQTYDYNYSFKAWTLNGAEVAADAVVTADATYAASYEATARTDANYGAYDTALEAAEGVLEIAGLDPDVAEDIQSKIDVEIVRAHDDQDRNYRSDDEDGVANIATAVTNLNQIVADYTDGEGNLLDEYKQKFTVTWVVEGVTVETDPNVPYGTTPSYDGETPSKAATAATTYVFDKWTPDLSDVTADVTYTATFTEVANYSDDEIEAAIAAKLDGIVDTEGNLPMGDCYTAETLGAYEDAFAAAQAFAGQPKTEENVDGFAAALDDLLAAATTLVVEHDYSGEPVASEPPSYDPVRDEYTYGSVTYNCEKDPTHPQHVVTINPADYTKEDGYQAAYDAIAELLALKETADLTLDVKNAIDGVKAQLDAISLNYTNSEEDQLALDNAVAALQTAIDNVKDQIYEADGETIKDDALNDYTILFVNTDGTELDSQTLKKGAEVVYGGADPVCPDNDAQYTYTWTGWTPEVVAVAADATYTAVYDMANPTTNTYTVTFVDEDGETVLLAAAEYDYGTVAADIIQPATPTKDPTDEWTYTFDKWTPALADVTADVTYIATYTKTANYSEDEIDAEIAAKLDGIVDTDGNLPMGDCYTDATLDAYEDALAAAQAFAGQPKTEENADGFAAALDDLLAAATALVVEHDYSGEPAVVAPSYNPVTKAYTDGSKTYTCQNDDTHEPKVVEVKSADYKKDGGYQDAYDAIAALLALKETADLTEGVKNAIDNVKAQLDAISLNYTNSAEDQQALDNAVAALQTAIDNVKDQIYEADGETIKDDALNHYTLTVMNNVNAALTTVTGVAGGTATLTAAAIEGYVFKYWSENANLSEGVYTFPAANGEVTGYYVIDLTDNEILEQADAIIENEDEFKDDYIEGLEALLEQLDEIKDDPTKNDEIEDLLGQIETKVGEADDNRLGVADYTAYDDAAEIIATLTSNPEITDEAKAYLENALSEQNAIVRPDGTPLSDTAANQQIIDDATAALIEAIEHYATKDPATDEYTLNEDALKHYTVTFSYNGGSATESDKLSGAVIDIPAVGGYTADGKTYVFNGWVNAADESETLTKDAATYTVTKNATFNAVYLEELKVDASELSDLIQEVIEKLDETGIEDIYKDGVLDALEEALSTAQAVLEENGDVSSTDADVVSTAQALIDQAKDDLQDALDALDEKDNKNDLDGYTTYDDLVEQIEALLDDEDIDPEKKQEIEQQLAAIDNTVTDDDGDRFKKPGTDDENGALNDAIGDLTDLLAALDSDGDDKIDPQYRKDLDEYEDYDDVLGDINDLLDSEFITEEKKQEVLEQLAAINANATDDGTRYTKPGTDEEKAAVNDATDELRGILADLHAIVDVFVTKHTLTINYNNGTTAPFYYENYVGKTYVLDMSLAVKPGATFDHWELTGAGTLDGNTFTFGQGDATVKAIYVGTQYTVKIDNNGDGIIDETVTVIDDGSIRIPMPAAANKTGFTFLGTWKDGDGNTYSSDGSVLTLNAPRTGNTITLTAQYSKSGSSEPVSTDEGFRCRLCDKNDIVQASDALVIYKLVYRIVHFIVHILSQRGWTK